MSLYLAIDAGGTKTTCLLAEESGSGTRILARASTGTVKLMRVSEELATARLQAMLEEVSAAACVSLGSVTRTCLGLSGFSIPAVRTWARQIVPAMVAGDFLLAGDEEIALDAAFAGGAGILVIAGTGSNIVGRSESGEMFTAGGWGPVLGDEGSGYWIGLEAVRAGLREHDRRGFGGLDTGLLDQIQRHWSLHSLAELVAIANQRVTLDQPVPDFADLAPIVAECAAAGDALSAGILERAGDELARQVALVAEKMFTTHSGGVIAATVSVALTGSVLSQNPAVRIAMVARLAIMVPNARVQQTAVDPLEGALWRAQRG